MIRQLLTFLQMIDPATSRPLFTTRCIELCCEKCKEEGKSAECVHMLHLVPSWQSEERHRKLKIMVLSAFCVAFCFDRFLALIVELAIKCLCACLVVAFFTMHAHCHLTQMPKYRCKTGLI